MLSEKQRKMKLSPMGILLLAGLLSGCKDNDRDQLRQVGNKTVEHIQSLAGGTRGKVATGLEAVRGAISERTIDSRATARLRWDSNLIGAEISVKLVKSGVVQLEGFVSSPAQKPQAVQLAQSTTGVEQVIDNLTVAPPPPNPPGKK